MKRRAQHILDETRFDSIIKKVDDALEPDGVGTTWDSDDLNIYLTTVDKYSEIVEYKIPIVEVMDEDMTVDEAVEYILDNM